MNEYRLLQEICATLQEDLRRQSESLFSANPAETAEEAIEKKLRSLSLYTSKSRLLRASREAGVRVIEERVMNDVDVVRDLQSQIQEHVINDAITKSLKQSMAVKNLLTTADEGLDSEMIMRKNDIKELYERLLTAETKLRDLNVDLQDHESEHARVLKEWDRTLGELKNNTAKATPSTVSTKDPKYNQMKSIVKKMEIIRRLISHLITSRTHYDWMEDPDKIFGILELTRTQITVEKFLEESEREPL